MTLLLALLSAPADYFEFIVHALSRVHMLEADGSMSRDDVDFVIATPWGQGLKSYHQQLLQPFTAHQVGRWMGARAQPVSSLIVPSRTLRCLNIPDLSLYTASPAERANAHCQAARLPDRSPDRQKLTD